MDILKNFEKVKYMSFIVHVPNILHKYSGIQGKIKELSEKDFNVEIIYENIDVTSKIKSFGNKS